MRIYKVYSDHEQRYCLTGLEAYHEAMKLRDSTGEEVWCDYIDLSTLDSKECKEVYELLEDVNPPVAYKSWSKRTK